MSRKGTLLSGIQKLDRLTPTADEKTASEYLCADGVAQIDVDLYEGVDLFNPLSYGKQRDLNSGIYELIDTKWYTIPLKHPIRICFHGCVPDPQNQNEIRKAILEHYMLLLRDKKEDLRINLLKAIGMAIFGVILLAIYFTLELTSLNPVFMELLSIAGWVAAWEAVGNWLLQRKALRIEYLNVGQAALSEVSFAKKIKKQPYNRPLPSIFKHPKFSKKVYCRADRSRERNLQWKPRKNGNGSLLAFHLP